VPDFARSQCVSTRTEYDVKIREAALLATPYLLLFVLDEPSLESCHQRRRIMAPYRISPIPGNVAEEARRTRRSPGYGHPVHEDVATGYGPCRECLRFFEAGRDRRLLLTYDAFHGVDGHALPGPIYIHAEPCARYPEDGGFPEWLAENALTMQAYDGGRRLVAEERLAAMSAAEAERVLSAFMARPDVDCVQVRDGTAGCFTFNVRPAAARPADR
jgi:hypothetical protein